MGGGSTPDAAASGANAAGIAARSAMDNAMFGVNYLTVIPGVDFAYIDYKLTVQVETTLLELLRVKGSDATAILARRRPDQLDGGRARGILRPADALPRRRAPLPALAVDADAHRDGHQVGHPHGQHGHRQLRRRPALPLQGRPDLARPGISYAQVVDCPFSDSHYKVVQIDVPFVFSDRRGEAPSVDLPHPDQVDGAGLVRRLAGVGIERGEGELFIVVVVHRDEQLARLHARGSRRRGLDRARARETTATSSLRAMPSARASSGLIST